MDWIIKDPALMGFIRETEGEEDVDTQESIINRLIKELSYHPDPFSEQALAEVAEVCHVDLRSLDLEDIAYIMREIR